MMTIRPLALAIALLGAAPAALAQDKGTLTPRPLPPLANPNDPQYPAKELFGRKTKPAAIAAARRSAATPRAASPGPWRCPSTGRTGRSCACRAIATGATRSLIALVERVAQQASADQRLAGPSRRRHVPAARRADADGPCLSPDRARRRHLAHPDAGPASRPRSSARRCPRRTWSATTGSTSTRPSGRPSTRPFCARSRRNREVARLFVNPAIKRALCREAGSDRGWLTKSPADLRPQLSLPHPHLACPAGASRAATTRTRRPPATAAARSSTPGSRPRMLYPEARPAAPADDHGAAAGRMPAGPCRTVMREGDGPSTGRSPAPPQP